jgi:hypothetical protein
MSIRSCFRRSRTVQALRCARLSQRLARCERLEDRRMLSTWGVGAGTESPLASLDGTFSITGPASPVTVQTPTITWEAATGAERYDLAISENSDLSNPIQVFHDLAATSQQTAPLPDGVYYVGVAAEGPNQDPVVSAGADQTIALGNGFTSAGSFVDPPRETALALNNGFSFKVDTPMLPGAFSILGPLGPVIDFPPTAEWEASTNADSYDLVVSNNSDLSSPLQSFLGLSETSQELDPLSDGRYYTGVTANNADGSTPATNNGESFLIDTVAPSVRLDNPVDGLVSDKNISVIGQVNDNLSSAATLTVEVDGVPVQPVTIDAAGNFSAQTALPLDGSADGTYVVTVQVTDEAGNSASASARFTLDTDATAPIPLAAATSLENTVAPMLAPVSIASAAYSATVDYGDGTGVQPLTLNPDGSFALLHDYQQSGQFTVTVNVLDGEGGEGVDTMVVTVLSAQDQVDQVLAPGVEALVHDDVLTAGQGNSLIAKLYAAVGALDRSNVTAAVNVLEAFINQVTALMTRADHLTPEQGQSLVDAAIDAIDAALFGSVPADGAVGSHRDVTFDVLLADFDANQAATDLALTELDDIFALPARSASSA